MFEEGGGKCKLNIRKAQIYIEKHYQNEKMTLSQGVSPLNWEGSGGLNSTSQTQSNAGW